MVSYQGYIDNRNMKGEDSEKGVLATGVVSHQGYTDNGNMTGFRGGLNRGGLSSGVH